MHQLLGDALSALGIEAEEKKMFGHHTMFLNGYMFAGGNVRGMNLRVFQLRRPLRNSRHGLNALPII